MTFGSVVLLSQELKIIATRPSSTLSTTTLQTRSKQNQEFNIETGEIQFRVSVQHLELISERLENNILEHLNAPHDT